jgi:hypothetical protein
MIDVAGRKHSLGTSGATEPVLFSLTSLMTMPRIGSRAGQLSAFILQWARRSRQIFLQFSAQWP